MKVLIKVKLSEHKSKTPEGYLICEDAIIARTGTQEYLLSEIYPDEIFDEDRMVSVDRPAEEVFSPETIASFENKPLTNEHPEESVNPENYKDLAVGFVRDVRKGTFDGQDVMLANLVVTDQEAIEDIENGKIELSCGYDCDITKGDNPKQVRIRGNHVALCEAGRAGIAKILDSEPVKDDFSIAYNQETQQFIGKQDSKSLQAKITQKQYSDIEKIFEIYGNDLDSIKDYFIKKNIKFEDSKKSLKLNDNEKDFYSNLCRYFYDKYNFDVKVRPYNSDESEYLLRVFDKKNKLSYDLIKSLFNNFANKYNIKIIHIGVEDGWRIDGEESNVYTLYYNEDNTDFEDSKKSLNQKDNISDAINLDFDYESLVRRELNPEYVYKKDDHIIAQFTNEIDADEALENSKLKNYVYNRLDDENASFVEFLTKDLVTFDLSEKINAQYKLYDVYYKGSSDNVYVMKSIKAANNLDAELKAKKLLPENYKIVSVELKDNFNYKKITDSYGKELFRYLDKYLDLNKELVKITDNKNLYSSIIKDENKFNNFINWYTTTKIKDIKYKEEIANKISSNLKRQRKKLEKEDFSDYEEQDKLIETKKKILNEIDSYLEKLTTDE